MEKRELAVAVAIAVTATIACFGFYLWLFDMSTGRLRTNVARGGAKVISSVAVFLRRRGVFLLVLAVVAVFVALLLTHFEAWTGSIRRLIGPLLSAGRP
jgi:hypothetical protein